MKKELASLIISIAFGVGGTIASVCGMHHFSQKSLEARTEEVSRFISLKSQLELQDTTPSKRGYVEIEKEYRELLNSPEIRQNYALYLEAEKDFKIATLLLPLSLLVAMLKYSDYDVIKKYET